MATLGHEEEIVDVAGLLATLQKLKTDIIDKKYEKPETGISKDDLEDALQTAIESIGELSEHVGKTDNPHSVTKKQVGLDKVGNFKAVSTESEQGLSEGEKSTARSNIGAGTSSFSGDYMDLSNKPTIPAEQKQADWNQSNTDAKDYIKNKPTPFSGSYNDLTDKPTIPENTDTKVTSVGNHYAPEENKDAELTASTEGTEGTYSLNTEYSVVTGVKVQRDAKGHVTGVKVSKQKVKDTNTDTTYGNATTESAGLMSAADKTKIDGVEAGAQAHIAPTLAEVKTALGTTEKTEKFLREDGTFAKPAYTVNTDTSVTSVENHYTPEADSQKELIASTDGDVGEYALDTEYEVVTGAKIQRDAAGHVTGIKVAKQKVKDTNTTYGNATVVTAGLMSSADKTKLNGVESGAQAHKAPTLAEIKTALGANAQAVDGNFLNKTGAFSNPFSGLIKESARVVTVTENTEASTSIAAGSCETVIYVNNTEYDYIVNVSSSSFKTPFGDDLVFTCPVGGYCEVNFININNVIYARGV